MEAIDPEGHILPVVHYQKAFIAVATSFLFYPEDLTFFSSFLLFAGVVDMGCLLINRNDRHSNTCI